MNPKSALKNIVVWFLSLLPSRLDTLSILMYHSISDSPAFFAVSPKEFLKQMSYIRFAGFTSIFASEISSRMKEGTLAETVCVTFDDGYKDFYTNAFPVLKTLRIKASVFLITDQIGGTYTTSEGETFPLLGREEIDEMRKSGLIEFLPHGHTHRKLHGLDSKEQEKEILSSREVLRNLTGVEPTVFAYPRGRTTPAIADLLKRNGFELGLGVMPGLMHKKADVYNAPRNAVDSRVGFQEFKLKLSNRIRWYAGLARLFS